MEELMAHVATCIGFDGCKRGWIGVYRNSITRQLEAWIVERLEFIDAFQYNCIAIDIPVGLPEKGSRQCDIDARNILHHRGCCVFPAPIRPLLGVRSYEEACRISLLVDGKKISKQTFNVIPKIAEVDGLLQTNPALREIIYEVHPEVSFCCMNKGIPLKNKKKRPAGKNERIMLIDGSFGVGTFNRLVDILDGFEGWGADDLLDACAALWTAERIMNAESKSVPEQQMIIDSTGLPMRIVF